MANGYRALEPTIDSLCKTLRYNAAACERGLSWSDLAIGIGEPVGATAAVLSRKVTARPRLADLQTCFHEGQDRGA